MLWDIGTYKVLDGHPVRAYHAGKLHLLLNGKKLKGEWALVRGRQWDNNGSKEPWFLIKSGADAKPISPRRDDQSVLTRRSMSRIASDKSHEWQSHR
jgi:bifunctional non-homologous end joining protein LigD